MARLEATLGEVGMVASREITERVRGRIFRIGTLVILVAVAAAIIIPTLHAAAGPTIQTVGVVGRLSPAIDQVVKTAGTQGAGHGQDRAGALARRSNGRSALGDGRLRPRRRQTRSCSTSRAIRTTRRPTRSCPGRGRLPRRAEGLQAGRAHRRPRQPRSTRPSPSRWCRSSRARRARRRRRRCSASCSCS